MDKPIPKAVELLRAFQSQFGARRPDEDEDDAETWGRIDAVCKALAAAQQQGQEVACQHENRHAEYDCMVCDDCGAIRTDGGKEWPVKNAWFASRDLAKQPTQQGGGEAAPPSAPAGVEELVERMRQAPSRLWMADLVGQKISVERMRDILTFALAQRPDAVGVKTLSEFMAEQEALHPGISDKVQAAADELRASLAQQQESNDELA